MTGEEDNREVGPIDVSEPRLVVVGAGAAGLGAAITIARRGLPTLLVEARPRIGGTVAHALIHTIGGLYDHQGELLNGGLAGELRDRVLSHCPGARKRQMGKVWTLTVDPGDYAELVGAWLAEEPLVSRMCSATAVGAEVAGGRVASLRIERAGGSSAVRVRAVVDATGTGAVTSHVDDSLVESGVAAPGLVLVVSGVDPEALGFPNVVGLTRRVRTLPDDHDLPDAFTNAWVDRGVAPDEAYVKISVSASEYARDERFRTKRLRATLEAALGAIPALASASVERIGELGIRDGGRIVGEYRLTESDVLAGRSFPDGCVRCCWPVEHWDPERGIELRYLPEGTIYEIPLRSLKVRGIENLWAAGKLLSAEPRAQASARVSGSCLSMGEAVGNAIA